MKLPYCQIVLVFQQCGKIVALEVALISYVFLSDEITTLQDDFSLSVV